MFKRLKSKDGGVILSLVVILMLIFPLITSGLMDITNCTIIKRNLKQNLNMAAKGAANTIDIESTRHGVYRIKDGFLTNEVYDFNIYNKVHTQISSNTRYYHSENDAAKVFFSILDYNNMIDYTMDNNDAHENFSYNLGANLNPLGSGNSYDKYMTTTFYQEEDYKNQRRESEFSILMINNDFDYVKYITEHQGYKRSALTLTNENICIKDVYDLNEEENINNVIVDATRPTAVGFGVVRYELSPIFRIFGYKNVYLKEYASAELIVSDNYWN